MNYGVIINETVSAIQAAELYGFKPNRANFINCPFHSGDNSASLKLYDCGNGFHCFGCGAHGTTVDFVMRVHRIDYKTAIKKINDDFSLGLPIDGKMSLYAVRTAKRNHDALIAKINAEKAERDEREERVASAWDGYNKCDKAIIDLAPESESDGFSDDFAEALKAKSYYSYLIDEGGG